MENRAGGVNDANMAGPAVGKNSTLDPIENTVVADIDGAATLSDFHSYLIDYHAAVLCHIFPVVAGEKRIAARVLKQRIDGRKFAQKVRGLIGHEMQRLAHETKKFNFGKLKHYQKCHGKDDVS